MSIIATRDCVFWGNVYFVPCIPVTPFWFMSTTYRCGSAFFKFISEQYWGGIFRSLFFITNSKFFFFVFEFSRIIGFRAAQNGWNKNKTATSTFLVQSQYLRRAALVEKFKADYLDNLLQRWSLLLRHPSIYR